MEIDDGVKATVASLLQISRIRLPLVVHALVNALEMLSKVGLHWLALVTNMQYTMTAALIDAPLDTIHSQLYLFHLLVLCLSESWKLSANQAAHLPSDLPLCWPDPPPLEDNLARQLLSVLVIYIRLLSQESTLSLSANTTPTPSKDGKSPSSVSVSSWSQQVSTPGSSSFSLGSTFIQQHSYPSAQSPPPPPVPEHAKLLAPIASSQPTAVKQLTKRVGRVIFYLSASNWPLVLSRIKGRIAHLTTTLEETPELFELRFLEWANVNTSRLNQALQEISTPFLHVKRPAQTALASALRKAIWNWIDVNPAEYHGLIEGTRKLDGSPDVLFDVLLSMSDSASSNKRGKTFYPLMGMLLILAPDSLKRIALGDLPRGSSVLTKKMSFLESLRKNLSQSKSFEACAVCYVDLVRAAMSCHVESSGIRVLLPDLQSDLRSALFYSSLSSEIVDINVLVDGLVALYRYNPSATINQIFPKLWNDVGSESSKVVGIRACATIAMEGQRLPWHPSARALRAEMAPSVRTMLRTHSASMISAASGRRGRPSLDMSASQTDVTWEILNLLALDPAFAFEGLGEAGEDSLSQLFVFISSLTSANCPMTIRAQASTTSLVILDYLVESAKTDASRVALAVNSSASM